VPAFKKLETRFHLTKLHGPTDPSADPSGHTVPRRQSEAARLLGMWVRMGMDVCLFVCCVLPDRGLCVGLFTCPEESYRVWCVE
jgi:hypothetical protein